MPTVFVIREPVPSSRFDFLARFEQSKQRVALDVGQALLMGERDRLSATVDTELRQHTLDVAPDRLWTDEEFAGDLRLGQTAGKQLQHLSLATCQRLSGGITLRAIV
jgi:hypothetical protein